ncbi:hypothetical protein RQP53_10520 [Paucibacter sp. APW11]|uniref:Carbohydrate kinase PfkB domain-containing protein n=1 Tax=Roseateles aquae TaxID=3077235 RepID=A0ABU3PAU2_9BURK|nr:hypothetical protein [Paucibacter sp. APW11]MDT8999700.1 hypothetical protein [Paucibacter sp. APW11]
MNDLDVHVYGARYLGVGTSPSFLESGLLDPLEVELHPLFFPELVVRDVCRRGRRGAALVTRVGRLHRQEDAALGEGCLGDLGRSLMIKLVLLAARFEPTDTPETMVQDMASNGDAFLAGVWAARINNAD